ncbi:surface protease GP63 [Trypanosoma theileri]|uniref:Leishmanolysin-like peptidase n=1 Tax=Trypanosoma theileri TaxID=67003 RepID=A0A1X0NDC6_9TRYP|nr:surface protease GP63 [Trypanosoma theileri]ORC80781.1 surface protease GP63 [Trypanosoma theileri]
MEKHSMRHLLWAALFLLYCSCGCLAAVVQQLPQKGQSALQAYTVSSDTAADDTKIGSDWKAIRIGVYTKLVEDMVEFCTTKKKEMPREYEELARKYEEEEEDADEEHEEPAQELYDLKDLCNADKITEDKKKVLFERVLPKAIKLHADRLKVKQVKGTLMIPRKEEQKIRNNICQFFKDPLTKNVTDGPVVDFMIFASLSKEPQKVVICSQDNENRPTSAVIKFIPKEIEATRQYIRLTAHEIAHGLGFQHELMKELNMIKERSIDLPRELVPYGRNEFYMVNSTKIVEVLKSHYRCKDGEIEGLYLEDEEDSDLPSHWERLIAKDELMSTYFGEPSGMYYSALTLAAFEGMKFYQAVSLVRMCYLIVVPRLST